jgi:hypothetical protein
VDELKVLCRTGIDLALCNAKTRCHDLWTAGSGDTPRSPRPGQELVKLRSVDLPVKKEFLMRAQLCQPTLALALVAVAPAACQSDSGTGVASGAAGGVGAIVGGPVGAAVGGVVGAAVGGVINAEEAGWVRTYAAAQRRPSIRTAEPLAVGQPAPRSARLAPVPASVGLRNPYSYTIVNERTVLVDPRTRQIVEIIE